MSSFRLNLLLDRVFRFNPAYELIAFDQLPAQQQVLLNDLNNDPDFFGVILDRKQGKLPIKSVCRDSARLIQSLERNGMIDRSAGSSDEESNEAIAALVLDGILEVRDGDRFVSGVHASMLIYSGHLTEAQGFLPRLSQAALEYAQALSIDDAARLSMRLYHYNRIPLTPQWTRRLSSEARVLDFLGVSRVGLKQELSDWNLMEDDRPSKAWFEWTSRRQRPGRLAFHEAKTGREGYKLYVSPKPEHLPTAFRAVVEALVDPSAHAFKVGRDVANLLRPDKLVIYFRDFEGLQQTADVLARTLAGCEAQGVPFTAPIGDGGMLSWGVDPAPAKGMVSWQGPESWRLWITKRLALSLVSALGQPTEGIEPWQFAMERLRLEEIDVATWTPTEAFGMAA